MAMIVGHTPLTSPLDSIRAIHQSNDSRKVGKSLSLHEVLDMGFGKWLRVFKPKQSWGLDPRWRAAWCCAWKRRAPHSGRAVRRRNRVRVGDQWFGIEDGSRLLDLKLQLLCICKCSDSGKGRHPKSGSTSTRLWQSWGFWDHPHHWHEGLGATITLPVLSIAGASSPRITVCFFCL